MPKLKFASSAVFAAALAITIMAGVALAGPSGPAGKSNTGQLYLFEKDPATWEVVADGAWGKMKYDLAGPDFNYVFNGHALIPGAEYELIYYPDPWPGNDLICLGEGVANNGGNVHIAAAVDTETDLPAAYDDNFGTGAKIWLVLAEDVDCENALMVDWDPTKYLFEAALINFDDTDVP